MIFFFTKTFLLLAWCSEINVTVSKKQQQQQKKTNKKQNKQTNKKKQKKKKKKTKKFLFFDNKYSYKEFSCFMKFKTQFW
jgi:flagellar biosynthesis component FlhA